jgi:hypothetical protein
MYSHYIPGFEGKIAVAREANRVWPISLPEETDVFIANKIVNQLRDLLYCKLVAQKNRIQEFYNQMKYDKRRKSHGELSSSGEESDKEESEKGKWVMVNSIVNFGAEYEIKLKKSSTKVKTGSESN